MRNIQNLTLDLYTFLLTLRFPTILINEFWLKIMKNSDQKMHAFQKCRCYSTDFEKLIK